jgi:hypothetical protein
MENHFIENVGDYITNNLQKIDGFDFRWSSLISSNPLLFEDINYLRVKPFIDNQITKEEIEAYKRGDLRDLYATFDNLLVCNLKFYDRILNYCTMVFMHYIEIDGELIKDKQAKLDLVPYELMLTPTKIWCAVLSNMNSTKWELEYAWGIKAILPIENSNKTIFELSWNNLYKNKTFAKFNEWNAFRCNTQGFRETLISDKTSNRKLSQVCSKFTKSSIALSEQQLETLYLYYKESEIINKKLFLILDNCLSILFNGDKSQYSIYIYTSEFFIFSSKFSIKVSKSSKGIITKDYLANSYECFAAEEFLIPSIKTQIEWAKYKLPQNFEYDKNILKSLLQNMLETNYREIVCIKRMNETGILSKITFSGIFNMVKIIEEFMIDNRTIKSITKQYSKQNAAKLIVEKGYIIFGIEKDILELNQINKKSLIKHYNNYCIPVIQYMFDIITMHNISKNDIIDVVISGEINPSKLNNSEIKYSVVTKVDSKQILSKGLDYQNKRILTNKKTYWRAID